MAMTPPPEIAIPSTSISDEGSSKPYTLYNITLRLPLRSFVVQKRYTDFVNLHNTLIEQAGAPPPNPLPGKHWIKSTIRSAELTKERQEALERYLRAIAESPDRRWRDAVAWRVFLNLPSAGATNSTVSVADPGTWLDVHRDLKQCLHEARQHLSRRDGAADSGNLTAAAEAAAAAKRVLVKASGLIGHLTEGVQKMQESGRLGEGELRRRRDLISAAKMERDGLDKLASSMPGSTSSAGRAGLSQVQAAAAAAAAAASSSSSASSAANRNSLIGSRRPAQGGRVLGAPAQETAKTKELDNQGVLMLQKQEMQAQDTQIDQLAAIIRRQKEMGIQISEEVERQTELLDALEADVDRVDGKIKVANRRLKKM
ncbi:Vacuolar morphogenesis protein 7 -like protein [Escovopsis weberi]|uniref:Vacuolar morphogenesis protein 7-like protein n=1 Tax=Escovopsis weberi TaxID=150374 RepID=A0A0M9VT66_ESCWE|nr:Vacuolar morphogenesis protein 7 -like protein [Escovopsis weberi]